MELERTTLEPLPVLVGGEGASPLLYLGGLLPTAGVDSSLARRLVLVGTGCRLSPKTRRLQARMARHVRAGHPRRALASAAVSRLLPGGEPLARLLAPLLSPLVRRAGDLSDLATTIEAEDGFDLARCAGTIAAPTLIVAGARDRFSRRPLLEETQRLIPGSVLRRLPRRGHLTVMSDPRLAATVRAFRQG